MKTLDSLLEAFYTPWIEEKEKEQWTLTYQTTMISKKLNDSR